MAKHYGLDAKRERAAARIEEVAPHIRTLIAMMDETKVDLILMAIAGETLPAALSDEVTR